MVSKNRKTAFVLATLAFFAVVWLVGLFAVSHSGPTLAKHADLVIEGMTLDEVKDIWGEPTYLINIAGIPGGPAYRWHASDGALTIDMADNHVRAKYVRKVDSLPWLIERIQLKLGI